MKHPNRTTHLFDRFAPHLILALAAFLRLFHLSTRDFWYDEAFTGVAIRGSWGAMMELLKRDVHPPLYYILLKMQTTVFGDSVLSLRLFSAVFGIACVGLVFAITQRVLSRRVAIYASLLAALSPFLVMYSQEARMYSLLGFLLLSAIYFLVQEIQTKEWKYAVAWGVFAGLAGLTHYMGLVFLPCLYVASVILRAEPKSLSATNIKKRLSFFPALLPSKRLILGFVMAGLVFLPWYPSFKTQYDAREKSIGWIQPAKFESVFMNLQTFLLGTGRGELGMGMQYPNQIPHVAEGTTLLLVAILASILCVEVLKKEKRSGLFAAALSLLFIGIMYWLDRQDKHYFLARYLLPASFFFYVIIGAWLASLSNRKANVLLAGYIALIFLTQPSIDLNSMGYNLLKKDLARYEGYHFYSLNSFDYMLSQYYFGKDRVTIYNASWPQFDNRDWPGMGPDEKRTEDINTILNDDKGRVLWNVQFPVEKRDDKYFDPKPFEEVSTYRNLKVLKPIGR